VKRFNAAPAVLTSILILFVSFFAAQKASATTYYVAANGADSNNGTAKTTPWQHAPGMLRPHFRGPGNGAAQAAPRFR
jgi:hypothetical protein